MQYNQFIIIGAARSGTNILRDILVTVPNWHSWDCDEIDFVWRYKNSWKTDDCFETDLARPDVCRFIKSQFDSLARKTNAAAVVEKTCANSLRIPFLNRIFPQAKFINIVRDGRDVTLSASQRWVAPVNYSYLLEKLKYVPIREIPFGFVQFAHRRLAKFFSKDNTASGWGPRFPGMETFVSQHGIEQTCAKQWVSCVEKSKKDFASIGPSRVQTIKFEELVTAPELVLEKLGDWLGENVVGKIDRKILTKLVSERAQSWKRRAVEFSPETLSILKSGLETHGYI